MKAVAIITETNNSDANQWQFDKVMSAIAYDMELSVVFMPDAINHITKNKTWNSLVLYGIDEIYFYNSRELIDYQAQFHIQEINSSMLRRLIMKVDIVL